MIQTVIDGKNRKTNMSVYDFHLEDKIKCPLEGNSLIKNIVYMDTVKTETNTSSYVGMTGNNFKTRYYSHIKSFNNKR